MTHYLILLFLKQYFIGNLKFNKVNSKTIIDCHKLLLNKAIVIDCFLMITCTLNIMTLLILNYLLKQYTSSVHCN